jgi:aminopeptidase N
MPGVVRFYAPTVTCALSVLRTLRCVMSGRGMKRAALFLVAGAVVLVAGCTAPPAPAGPASPTASASGEPSPSHDFRPGAEGIGDPYFPTYGNGGYDVASYSIKVKYDPKTDVLNGDVTINATASQDLSRYDLDLAGLTVRSVTVDGAAATFSRTGNELVVTPAAGLASGAAFATRVIYDGKPEPVASTQKVIGSGGFFATKDGAIVVGQPESASSWYPVNDHPLDKATYAIEATVPDGLAVISNGVPGPHTSAGGWTTWAWSEGSPMASYLTTLVIGRYRVSTSTHSGKPVVSAVTTSVPKGGADTSMAHTIPIVDFLESQFGPYPFDAYGGVVVQDDRIHFALETQSRPVYSAGFFRNGVNDWVVAHELAHQWYGDSVAVHGWEDIWLNEGFATYAEWLWNAHAGVQSVQTSFNNAYRDATPAVWSTPPAKPGAARIFDESVYNRGAMTLQMLRKAVGDTAFFTILKKWAADKRDGNATTAEFIAMAESVSGKKLGDLFDAWLYATKKPSLS